MTNKIYPIQGQCIFCFFFFLMMIVIYLYVELHIYIYKTNIKFACHHQHHTHNLFFGFVFENDEIGERQAESK